MLNRSIILFALSSLVLACGGGGGGGSNGPGPFGENRDCSDVITDAKIEAFNSSQSDFYVTGGGGSVTCSAQTTVNGKSNGVEVKGHGAIRVVPGLKYLKIEPIQNKIPYEVYMTLLVPTADDAKAILSKMGIPAKDGEFGNYQIAEQDYPAYVRFGKGMFFFTQGARITMIDRVQTLVFRIGVDEQMDEGLLISKIVGFLDGKNTLEVLWYPRQGQLARQTASSAGWSQVRSLDAIKSMVKEDESGATSKAYKTAIHFVTYWAIEPSVVNKEVPELYAYASSRWQNPAIADNTANELVQFLRYIVKVNPSSSLKPVADTYDQLTNYQGSIRQSLQESVDYAAGKSWTKDQMDFLLAVSAKIGSGSATWETSKELATLSNWDRTKAFFIADVAGALRSRGLVNSGGALLAAQAKIAAGMNTSNVGTYFSSFDQFKKMNAGSSEAELTCDELVLSGKLNSANSVLFFSTMVWIKDTTYASFSENLATMKTLSQGGALDNQKVTLFKQAFTWFKDTLYLSRTLALEKSSAYVGLPGFTAATFKAVQDLFKWFADKLYINKTESLERTEKLVLVLKLSAEQTNLFRALVDWLTDKLYVTKSDALAKGEMLATLSNGFNAAKFAQFKDLANWYINELYINKSDALNKTENLTVTLGFDKTQTDAMKSAVDWLRNDLYINKSDSIEKGEVYLIQKKLTAAKVALLKQEFKKFYTGSTSKADALKKAEDKVLGL